MINQQLAVISMGSNLPNGKEKLQEALEWISQYMTETIQSDIYTSEATDGNGSYFNVVVEGKMRLSAEEFEVLAKEHEKISGRERPSKTVALDIDLVSLGGNVIRPAELCRLYFLQGYNSLHNLPHRESDDKM